MTGPLERWKSRAGRGKPYQCNTTAQWPPF